MKTTTKTNTLYMVDPTADQKIFAGEGTINTKFINHEGCFIDITDGGIDLFFSVKGPTPRELQDFASNAPLEIRSCVLNDCLCLYFKTGTSRWQETFWFPADNEEITVKSIPDGCGIPCNLHLVNAWNGELVKTRKTTLGTDFSRKLQDQIVKVGQSAATYAERLVTTSKLMLAYGPKEMLRFMTIRWKLHTV